MKNIKLRAWDGQKLGQVAVLNIGNLVSFVGSANDFFIADSVMLSVVLKDKNGVEIYEEDILRNTADKELIGVVVYESGGFNVLVRNDLHTRTYMILSIGDHWEKIGTIHENPEMLGS